LNTEPWDALGLHRACRKCHEPSASAGIGTLAASRRCAKAPPSRRRARALLTRILDRQRKLRPGRRSGDRDRRGCASGSGNQRVGLDVRVYLVEWVAVRGEPISSKTRAASRSRPAPTSREPADSRPTSTSTSSSSTQLPISFRDSATTTRPALRSRPPPPPGTRCPPPPVRGAFGGTAPTPRSARRFGRPGPA
jgi:hypothetical protein